MFNNRSMFSSEIGRIYRIGPYEYVVVDDDCTLIKGLYAWTDPEELYNPVKLKLLHTQHPVYINVHKSELTEFVGFTDNN